MEETTTEIHPTSINHLVFQLSNEIWKILSRNKDAPEGRSGEVKTTLESLLPVKEGQWLQKDASEAENVSKFFLSCAALASAGNEAAPTLSWLSTELSAVAVDAIAKLSESLYNHNADGRCLNIKSEFRTSYEDKRIDLTKLPREKRLIIDMIPTIFPTLKDLIKNSCSTRKGEELDSDIPTVPLATAIVASHQLRWCLKQIQHPYLGPLAVLILPCTLTALDHWSPDIKRQALTVFTHLGNNLNSAELLWYKDVILDAISQNITGSEKLWHQIVETAVLLSTRIEGRDPRSKWYGVILNEMLGELERHANDIERRVIWLRYIEPLMCAMGLVLLAYFRRLFPLFFHWLQAEDDTTLRLVIQTISTVIKLTWIRNTPYLDRLVKDLVEVYKRSRGRKSRSDICSSIIQVLGLLHLCKGERFVDAWCKYKDDSIELPKQEGKRD